MRIVAISDTHQHHRDILLPPGDVLIHAGDFTSFNDDPTDFLRWFVPLPYKHKLLIAGNHELFLEEADIATEWKGACQRAGFTYLQDDACEIDGVKFYGAPWTPTFHNWAFNADRGSAIARHWRAIPDDVNVLITHGPPMGIMDESGTEHVGCEELAKRIGALKQLKASIFGHIHRTGQIVQNGVRYVNASQCGAGHILLHQPQVFDIESES